MFLVLFSGEVFGFDKVISTVSGPGISSEDLIIKQDEALRHDVIRQVMAGFKAEVTPVQDKKIYDLINEKFDSIFISRSVLSSKNNSKGRIVKVQYEYSRSGLKSFLNSKGYLTQVTPKTKLLLVVTEPISNQIKQLGASLEKNGYKVFRAKSLPSKGQLKGFKYVIHTVPQRTLSSVEATNSAISPPTRVLYRGKVLVGNINNAPAEKVLGFLQNHNKKVSSSAVAKQSEARSSDESVDLYIQDFTTYKKQSQLIEKLNGLPNVHGAKLKTVSGAGFSLGLKLKRPIGEVLQSIKDAQIFSKVEKSESGQLKAAL